MPLSLKLMSKARIERFKNSVSARTRRRSGGKTWSAMNAQPSAISTPLPSSTTSSLSKNTNTIRLVPAEAPVIETVIDESRVMNKSPSNTPNPISMPHSTHSTPSVSEAAARPQFARQQSVASASQGSNPERMSSPNGSTFTPTNSIQSLALTNSNSNGGPQPTMGNYASPVHATGNPSWSSAVGRASLGKSGRVIETLQSMNDKLTRDKAQERARADEAELALKVVLEKMEQMQRGHEMQLHAATTPKSSIMRTERLLAKALDDLQAEKAKTAAAVERELFWKAEMQRIQEDAQKEVEAVHQKLREMKEELDRTRADGDILRTTWNQRKAMLNREIDSMRKEIAVIAKERKEDDEKFKHAARLSNQQAAKFADLVARTQLMQKQFADYKRVRDEGLRDLTNNLIRNEKKTEENLTESTKVTEDLKWVLALGRLKIDKSDLHTKHYRKRKRGGTF